MMKRQKLKVESISRKQHKDKLNLGKLYFKSSKALIMVSMKVILGSPSNKFINNYWMSLQFYYKSEDDQFKMKTFSQFYMNVLNTKSPETIDNILIFKGMQTFSMFSFILYSKA